MAARPATLNGLALITLALLGATACGRDATPPPADRPAAAPPPADRPSPPPAERASPLAAAAEVEDAAVDRCAGVEQAPEDALVEVTCLDDSIRVEMPYATADNLAGVALYPRARCLLRREVAGRLASVQAALRRQGLGLKLWDCYRPFRVQERLWALVPDGRYVARPVRDDAGRPIAGSKHNRGAAVDATLVDRTGREVEMPTGHDDFSERAHRGSPAASPEQRRNAAVLEAAMVAQDFEPLATEWWHFDGPGWDAYELADLPLGDRARRR